jgi:hypothetical protein
MVVVLGVVPGVTTNGVAVLVDVAYVPSPEYTPFRSAVPRGSAVVVHDAECELIVTAAQFGLVIVVYVVPSVEYSKLTVPEPAGTFAVIVIDCPTTCGDAGSAATLIELPVVPVTRYGYAALGELGLYDESPEYVASRYWVPAGMADVVQVAVEELTPCAPQPEIVVYVIPSGEAVKLIVPSLTVWVTVAVMVTDPPNSCEVVGVALVIVVVLGDNAKAGAAKATLIPTKSKIAVIPRVTP